MRYIPGEVLCEQIKLGPHVFLGGGHGSLHGVEKVEGGPAFKEMVQNHPIGVNIHLVVVVLVAVHFWGHVPVRPGLTREPVRVVSGVRQSFAETKISYLQGTRVKQNLEGK